MKIHEHEIRTVIPAQPGYRAVFEDTDGLFVDHCEIIAWAILECEEYPIVPVTKERYVTNSCGLVRPDGRVELVDNGTFEHIGYARLDALERRLEREARAK